MRDFLQLATLSPAPEVVVCGAVGWYAMQYESMFVPACKGLDGCLIMALISSVPITDSKGQSQTDLAVKYISLSY